MIETRRETDPETLEGAGASPEGTSPHSPGASRPPTSESDPDPLPPPIPRKFRNLLVVSYIAIVVLVLAAAGFLTSSLLSTELDTSLGRHLSGIAGSLDLYLDEESLAFLGRTLGDRAEIEVYDRLRDDLLRVVSDHGLSRIVIATTTGKLLVDSERRGVVGSPVPLFFAYPDVVKAALGGERAATVLYQSQHSGYVKAVFAPIRRKGTTVALVAIEGTARFFLILDRLRGSLIFVGVLALFFTTFLALLVANTVTGPISNLVAAAARVISGDLTARATPPGSTAGTGEVAFLATVWDEMIAKLAEKERALLEMIQAARLRAADLESENAYLLASMPAGLLAVDPDLRVVRLNRAGSQILALPESVLLGLSLRSFLEGREVRPVDEHGAHDRAILTPLARVLVRAIESDRNLAGERVEVDLPQGVRRHLQCEASRVVDRAGRTIGSAVFFSDVTLEVELTRHLNLERHLAALGELSARVAHEIRNPLAVIRNYATLARRPSATADKTAGYMDEIVREVDSANKIVSEFLTFARPGDRPRVTTGIFEAIARAVDSLSTLAHGRKIAVEVQRRCHETASVLADPETLRQVFGNLLRNAIEASPEQGRVSITIECDEAPEVPGAPIVTPSSQTRENASSGRMLRLTFADEGPGIREELRDKIFDPFFTTKATGTGLGLAIVAKNVADLGGRIDLSNRRPTGLAIEIRLPLTEGTSA